MNLKDKKVLIVGLAKTGISTIKYLNKLGANIIVNDIKTEDKLVEILDELKDINNIEYIFGTHPKDIKDLDLAVVSPGVPLDLDFILNLKEHNIEIIGEVELAYRLNKAPTFIGITGTNGKTTTTTLVGEIFKASNKDTFVVGNIGNPVIDTVDKTDENSFLVTELSSYQLESIDSFRPSAATILNITEDHLLRHHTMENYANAKARIFKNQGKNDFCILNYDDERVRNLSKLCNSRVIFFSQKEKLDDAIYLEDDNIILNIDKKQVLLNKNELSLPGAHNLENCMAAAALAYVLGIDISIIRNVLKTFAGVEHRQEFVKNISDITFINDSKATNPDSTIKAIQSYNKPIILIAGGQTKQSDYTQMLEIAKENVRSLVLLGETAPVIEKVARDKGFTDIYVVNNMKEAVKTSYEIANKGDVVLLSPACASWDMYKNFEARGNDFKDNVDNL
jgi:UDP-N-acetylmuramoylalanine--D-glutamate ligase